MFGILITTGDFDQDGKFEIVDRESFFDYENSTNEYLADLIYKNVMEYKNHLEVRVRYSLQNNSLNRAFTGELLKSHKEQIKYDIVRDLIKVATHVKETDNL